MQFRVSLQAGTTSPEFSIFLAVHMLYVEVREIADSSMHNKLSIVLVKEEEGKREDRQAGRKEGEKEKVRA